MSDSFERSTKKRYSSKLKAICSRENFARLSRRTKEYKPRSESFLHLILMKKIENKRFTLKSLV